MAEEGGEFVDPQRMLREECREEKECAHYKVALEKCARRVERHLERVEECSDELIDFMHCTEHCVAHTLFSLLK